MLKRKGSWTWAWWVAGGTALAILTPHYLNWSNQPEQTPGPQHVAQAKNKPDGGQAVRGTPGIDHARYPAVAGRLRELGAYRVKVPHGDIQRLGIDPEEIYQALMSVDPGKRDQALETASRFAKALYPFNAIYKRIMEISSEDDPQVAERARYAMSSTRALRAAHEIPEPPEPHADEVWQNDAGTTGFQDVLETALEPLDTLRGRALGDPDPAVRLGGIEAAMSQRDEDTLDLLSQAVRADYAPDNRLTAVSELEQMLKSGLGDREQILQLLEGTAADPDERVAELSRLIIQEQRGQEQFGHPQELQHHENQAWQNEVSKTGSQDLPETAVQSFDIVQEQALFDPDPAVRLSGIESAIALSDRDSLGLLAKAALGDYEPDNRLSAVSQLEQMVKSGLGEREQILELLQAAAADPDPRVAELSQLIILEQLNAQ